MKSRFLLGLTLAVISSGIFTFSLGRTIEMVHIVKPSSLIERSLDEFEYNDPPSNHLGRELWKAQHLNGTQEEWFSNSGGGEFNSGTGNSSISSEVARSGKYSLKMQIDTRSGSGHGTRNYRWNEISRKEDLIFTQYFYFPNRIDFDKNNDWFNLIQTKGVKFAEGGAGTGPDQINLPHFVLGLEVRGGTGSGGPNYLSLADLQKFWGGTTDRVWKAPNGVNIPTNKWVKVQIRLIQDRGDKGRVLVWQDDELIIDTGYLNTLKPEVDTNMYSINAYADRTYPDITNIFVDDLSINLPAELEEKKENDPEPPKVKIKKPINNSEINIGETVRVEAEVEYQEPNELLELNYYVNGEKIGTSSKEPHYYKWEPTEPGEYELKVVTLDKYLQKGESELIKIVVNKKESKQNIENYEKKEAYKIKVGANKEVVYNNNIYKTNEKKLIYSQNPFTFSNPDASDEELFTTEINHRNLSVEIPLKNGKYTVKTYHNELWFGHSGPIAQQGRRIFDIYIQNEIKIENFDLFIHNNNKQTILTFKEIDVIDEKLTINMIAKENRATLSAITIIPESLIEEKEEIVEKKKK